MRLYLPLAAMMFSVAAPVHAEEIEQQAAQAAPQFAGIEFIKFKPGRKDRGLQIFRDYVRAADKLAGINADSHGFSFLTGEWDAIWITPVGDSLDAFEGSNPDHAAWAAALVQVAGSPEKAGEVMGEFHSITLRRERHHVAAFAE